jgi:hypothetical protein
MTWTGHFFLSRSRTIVFGSANSGALPAQLNAGRGRKCIRAPGRRSIAPFRVCFIIIVLMDQINAKQIDEQIFTVIGRRPRATVASIINHCSKLKTKSCSYDEHPLRLNGIRRSDLIFQNARIGHVKK